MRKILTKEELDAKLRKYYEEHYGESDTDEWLEQLAANVWCFKRGDQYVSLKAHILSGEIQVYVEDEENGSSKANQ